MACRTPVISTPVGAAPDVIRNGENGFVVESDHAVTMAEKAISLLSAPDEDWVRMSDAAWNAASSYTWSDATDLFEVALERSAADRESPEAQPAGL
jgi:glycosyltransferase involved in cell wall biosynthesis